MGQLLLEGHADNEKTNGSGVVGLGDALPFGALEVADDRLDVVDAREVHLSVGGTASVCHAEQCN